MAVRWMSVVVTILDLYATIHKCFASVLVVDVVQ